MKKIIAADAGRKRALQLLVAAAALLTAVAASPALAGAPFVTDDPEPTDYGHYEVDLYTSGTQAEGQLSGTAAGFEVDYGILPDLSVQAVLPWNFAPTSGNGTAYSLSEVDLGAKYRVVAEDTDGYVPEISVAPAVTIPTSDMAGTHTTHFQLPVIAQKTFGDWTSFGEVSFNTNSGAGSRNYVFFGAALVRQIFPDFAVGAEVFGQTKDTVGGKASLNVGVGASYDLNDHWHLMASVNTGVVDHDDNEVGYYVGVQFTI